MAQTDFVSRGQDLVLGGQYQEAVKVCRLGLLARPTDVSGRLVLGQALLALRRYDEVLAEMRVAIELDGRNAGAHQLKGEALLRKGDAFAAVDVLERARELAPSDPAIAGLLAEGRLAIAADGARTTGPALGDYGDSLTKHYPAHRGGDAGPGGSGGSGSLTRPLLAPAPARGTRAAGSRKGERARTPPPDELAIGDRSGTVELQDLEVEELDDDDPVAEPPRAAAAGTGTSSLSVDSVDLVEVDDEGEPILDEDDDVDFEPQVTAAQRPSARGVSPLPARRGPPPAAWELDEEDDAAGTNAKGRLPVRPPPATGEQPTLRRPMGTPGPGLGPDSALHGARDRDPTRGTPSRLGDVHAGPLPDEAPSRGPAGLPAMPPGADPPSISGGPVVPRAAPQAKTMVPMNLAAARPTVNIAAEPDPRAAPMLPTHTGPMAPAMLPTHTGPLPPLGAHSGPMPASGPALHSGPMPAAPPSADLDLIRAGLGSMPPDSTGIVISPPTARPSSGGPGSRPETELVRPGSHALPGDYRPRRRWTLALWAAITVVIIGGGVVAGFWIRNLRLDKQIANARQGADTAARADTWQGWRSARDRLVGVNRARPTSGHRAALARARAVLAADYADDLDGARAAVKELGELGGKDAALARAWVALADGDAAAARNAAAAAGPPDDADVGLVTARAALVEGRWDDAAAAARTAVERDPRPATALVACEAEAARKRWADAEKACGDALTRTPGHPGATILRARVRAGSGAARQDPAKLVAELEALVTEAGKPPAEQGLGVSPGQASWAQLAIAEIQLAIGDVIAARRALERSQGARIDVRGFLEAEAAVLLALGDIGAARAAAERGLARWTGSAPFAIVLARARLAAGDSAGAADVLGKLTGAAATTMDALLARAELARATGDLEAAERDLDAALAKAPDFEDALVARAEVDLDRGDARAALARVEPRYGPQASAPIAIVYAAAKRATRQLDVAREALARWKDAPPGPIAGRAWLEIARLERDAGELTPARAAYAKAAEMLPASRAVRLESAVLLVDDGDAAGGRDALARLAADARNDGAVHVELARAQILTGELTAAAGSLDLAEQAGAPKLRVARERGRLALRKRDVAAAVSGLEAAAKAAPDDLETRLLLMDTYLVGGNITGAQQLADELTRTYPGRPETHLARGRLELFGERPQEALKQFTKARELMAKAPRRQRADANFWLAQAAYATGDLARAKSILLEATSTDAYHADAWSVRATVLSELADFGAAAQAAEKAIALDPENVDAYFVLGEALALSRRVKESKTPLQEYLRRAGPDGARVEDARALLKKR